MAQGQTRVRRRAVGGDRSAAGVARSRDLPETASVTPVLFTIGYERRTQAVLVGELAAAGVALLADVRELPLSRRAGFSKTALAAAVEEAGIEYRHLRPLGNPKPARDAWKRGDAAAGIAGYRAHLREVPGDVSALAERVAEGGVCLLCVEHDPAGCHRTLLAEALRGALGELDVRDL
jgi:uncharacterized protein (DUF488 family)